MGEKTVQEEKKERVVSGGEHIESLAEALDEERLKAERYLANWQSTQADLSRLERRAVQEKTEVAKFGNSRLIINLLPVLDDLERAFDFLPVGLVDPSWVDRIRPIYGKLQAILEAEGVSQIEAVGKAFDPHLHEAVMCANGEEGMVIEEVLKGYKLHDRVIRPSKVIVGKGKTTEGGQYGWGSGYSPGNKP